jgi:hypothetical protein
MQKILKTG